MSQTFPSPPAAFVSSDEPAATILLVEDEESVRNMCRQALELDGARVVEAPDGEVALTLLQDWTGPLDLVITDLTMPKISGREVAEVLSVFRPDVPVLGMTGDPGSPDRRLPMLVKPFPVETLVETARLMRSSTIEIRTWAQEKRVRAREARRLAAEMKARHNLRRNQVDLVAVAVELQRLGRPVRGADTRSPPDGSGGRWYSADSRKPAGL